MPTYPPVDESKEFNKVLLIGSGGREHAIAWKLAKSPKVFSYYWGGRNLYVKYIPCFRSQGFLWHLGMQESQH